MLGPCKANRPDRQNNDVEELQFKDSNKPPSTQLSATRDIIRKLNCLSGGSEYEPAPFIRTVEWEMLDKSKFFPMSMMSSFTVRCFLYPLTLIRTRLQVQKGKEVYSGTYDAGRKILQNEGIRGLYRGFFISAFQIVSGLCYGKIQNILVSVYFRVLQIYWGGPSSVSGWVSASKFST